MYCRVCGCQMPDNDVFCPECGTRQKTQESATPVGSGWGGSQPMPVQNNVGLIEQLQSLYTARKVPVILGAIMTGLALLLVYFVLTGVHSFYGYYYADESLTGFINFMAVMLIINAVAMLIIGIWQLVILNNLKYFEERFGKAFLYTIFNVLIGFLSAFASGTGAKLVFAIAEIVIGMLASYHFCGAFADITRPWDRSLADKWDFVFKLYIADLIVGFLSGIIIGFCSDDPGNWGGVYFFSFVASAFSFAVAIYELKKIKETIYLFQKQR